MQVRMSAEADGEKIKEFENAVKREKEKESFVVTFNEHKVALIEVELKL